MRTIPSKLTLTLATALTTAALAGCIPKGFKATATNNPVDVNVSAGITLPGPGLALRGFDPVSYFTNGQPTLGSSDHSVVYNNATYRFSSKENADTFSDNPETYAPQYGGFCAYGVSVGSKFDGDPMLWKIVNNKLYLNLNPKIQATWSEEISENIAKADLNWEEIKHKSPDALK